MSVEARKSVKSRFSPSPTGLLHLGSMRTALFNVLFAKSQSIAGIPASFLLRIEDTDLERSKEEYTASLITDLQWLDMHWQEGPIFQSQRTEEYERYYQKLIQSKRAYPCFCSELELTLSRKTQLGQGKAPRYMGTCRNLTPEQVAEKRAKELPEALRFLVGDNTKIEFVDLVQGPKVFFADDIGDFIIRKADGSSSFMFCNAIDDAVMGVTHAIRGEDHLTNTPRQLLILDALGLPRPNYGHIPLIVGQDGKPLSKRNGSQAIHALKEQGYFPLAILNYLARLGHHYEPELDQKCMSLSELGQHFSLHRIGRAPAHFDLQQLNHWQKEAVHHANVEDLWPWMKPYVIDAIPMEFKDLFVETVKSNVVMPMDAEFWAKTLFHEYEITSDAQLFINQAGKSFYEEVHAAISQFGADYNKVVGFVKSKTQLKGKSLFMPLRAAITGVCYGPEMEKLFVLLGKERLIARISQIQTAL